MRLHSLVVVVVVSVVSVGQVYAAEPNSSSESLRYTDADVVFQSQPEYGGYLAATTAVGEVTDEVGGFLGVRGGIIVSQVLTLGAGGNWLVDGPSVDIEEAPPLRMGYGGGLIGITIASDAVVHPTVEVLIGGGEVRLDVRDGPSPDKENVFVVDASGGFDVNLTPGIRVHLGGGYRYLSDVSNLPGLVNEDVRGFFGTAQLKFGMF